DVASVRLLAGGFELRASGLGIRALFADHLFERISLPKRLEVGILGRSRCELRVPGNRLLQSAEGFLHPPGTGQKTRGIEMGLARWIEHNGFLSERDRTSEVFRLEQTISFHRQGTDSP